MNKGLSFFVLGQSFVGMGCKEQTDIGSIQELVESPWFGFEEHHCRRRSSTLFLLPDFRFGALTGGCLEREIQVLFISS